LDSSENSLEGFKNILERSGLQWWLAFKPTENLGPVKRLSFIPVWELSVSDEMSIELS
jgi:hypothetical protein